MTHPLKFHWFLPTNGGRPPRRRRRARRGRHPVRPPGLRGLPRPDRPRRRGHRLRRRAHPAGAWCEDAWLSTAMLSQVSERLKFLVAFRPGLVSPMLAAQMAGTFQSLSGGTAPAQRRHRRGEPRAADVRRLPRQGRALRRAATSSSRSCGRLWRGETVDFRRRARARRGGRAGPGPGAGAADLLRRLVAGGRRGRGEARRRLPDLGRAAGAGAREDRRGSVASPRQQGREIPFGIRLHVITRDTAEEAWAEAAG